MKKPQTERAMRRREAEARWRSSLSAVQCPEHATQIRYGTPTGWHRFRCGCESSKPA